MTYADAFLAAIIDTPDDDTPRLVYADWLDEHGQGERAEFIRVQCALAKLPDNCGCKRCDWRRKYGRSWGHKHPTGDRCHDPGKALRDRQRRLWFAGWCPVGGKRPRSQRHTSDTAAKKRNGGTTYRLPQRSDWFAPFHQEALAWEPELPIPEYASSEPPATHRFFGGYQIAIYPWQNVPTEAGELRRTGERIGGFWDSPPMTAPESAGEWLGGYLHTVYRRGFAAVATCEASTWASHGREICRVQPLERLIISDKRPGYRPNSGQGYDWLWWHEPENSGAESIPMDWWKRLRALHAFVGPRDEAVDGVKLVHTAGYPSEAAAIAALSAAALAWARAS